MNWKTIFIAIALFFSSTAYAQITLDWETDSQFKHIYLSNGLIIGEFRYKHFVVTSGSGYIDMEATLDLDGSSTMTRMWVEEGIEYAAQLKFNLDGGIVVEHDEYCYTVTLDSATSSPPGMARKLAAFSFDGLVVTWICPETVTFIPQTDELQVNASDGTFADHVRITWNEVPGATGYEVFRCTGLSPQLPNDEDSSCAAAIGSSSDNGFNDTGGLEEVSYWYRVKSCTDGVCSAFSEYDEGYRHDEDDHGNNCDEATSVNANSTSPGALQNWWAERYYDRDLAYDKDFFRVDLPSVGSLTVQTTGSTSTHGTLLDAECTEIVQSNDDDENNNFLINEELAAGTYYVGIRGVSYIPNPLKYGFQKLQDDTGPYQFVSSFEPTSSLPSPPAQVSASDGTYTDIIAVTWSSVASATAYNVYYSSSLGSAKTLLGQYTSTSVNVTGAAPGDVWYFWVYSVNVSGESATGTYDTGYIQSTAPEPADLAITILDAVDGTYASGDKLIVTNKTENIGGTASGAYRITFYASTDMTITTGDFSIGYIDRTALGVGESHYFNTTLGAPFNSLQDGSYYIGAILSIDDANNSNNSKFDPTPIIISNTSVTIPDAPTLNSVAPGNGYALLVFTANSDGGSAITGYTASCGAINQAGASSPITVSGLTNGIQYSCSVLATNAMGDSASSNSLTVTPNVVPTVNNELRNIATRAEVRTGNEILIGGFVIVGDTQKCVVIQALGGSVAVPTGVTRLADPIMELKSGLTTIAQNDNWQDQTIPSDVQLIIDSGRAPNDILEAAIYKCLDPGAYTALVRGFQQSTGVGIVAVYDADDSSPYLKNIATRSWVGIQHAISIAGFVVTGNSPKQILVVGLGPSIQERFPQLGALSDPWLRLYQGPNLITTNDDWGDAANAADIAALAPPLPPTHAKEPAIMMILEPGLYTAHMLGVGGEKGIGNVAVYDLTGRQ